jgi:sugar-specific transcriptional regulator TrmB
MKVFNPYLEFNFNDAEENIYKLLIQLSLIPRKDSKSPYHKIKATDLVEISKYSKPKVYDIIKRLEERNLIQVDNTRPMFLKPINPEIAIQNLLISRKNELEKASESIINELKSLPKLDINYSFSEVPPLTFITGIEEYHKLMRNALKGAKDEVILIIAYLVRDEEGLLRDYIKGALKRGIKVKILYGGPPKFRIYFRKEILEPNKISENQISSKIDVKAINFAPPLRMTLVDNRELVLTLIKGSRKDSKINISEVSALHSDHEELMEYARRTYILLRPTADARLAAKLKG